MENKKVKTILAKVLSNKMDKSATVIVERQIKHPVNGKFIKRTSKYHIHDENNECEVGQQVKIQPGKVLYEMEGVSEEVAREAFRLAAAKLPIITTFVTRAIM